MMTSSSTPPRPDTGENGQPGALRPGGFPAPHGLYHPGLEHDACGVGFVVNINGEQTHRIVEQGIEVLERLLHRGAVGGDANTGDGAGILIQVPDEFCRRCAGRKVKLPPADGYGVGVVFLPTATGAAERGVALIERCAIDEGLKLLAWRRVPTDDRTLGESARHSQPDIRQFFVAPPPRGAALAGDALERKLYVLRRTIERAAQADAALDGHLYLPSLSARTLIYKGLLTAPQLPAFYPDLRDREMASALALIHQRYSTNTFPTWALAQPFRYLAHNGEINTLRGNLNQMRAREGLLESPLFGADLAKLRPIIQAGQSDSACLDNALELLTRAGRSIPHAMLMLVPEAWGEKYHLGPDVKGFFEYHAGIMEPWDGPAAVAFADGRHIGAMLDRNGLRPTRYTITKSGFMVLASEAGVLDIPPAEIAAKGRLRPGQILCVDLDQRRVLFDAEMKSHIARRQPYRRWVAENRITLHGLFDSVVAPEVNEDDLVQRQRLFGYTREEVRMILVPMAETGHEPTGSMGNDAALAVLSEKPQLLYSYFKQLFAQITNPPIDPIREELVMSLTTFVGRQKNLLAETPQHAHLLRLKHPLLTAEDLARLRNSQVDSFRATPIPIGFFAAGRGMALRHALGRLCEEAENAVRNGSTVLILSDRNLFPGQTPMPALLAVSCVNHHLIHAGLRTQSALVLETGEAREIMHFALLLGYGATAINPYLALETIAHLTQAGRLRPGLGVTTAVENYIDAVAHGLLKVMSKMGISTLRSYRGAQIFEAVGINHDVIDAYFTGTASRVGGIGLEEIAHEANARTQAAGRPVPGMPLMLEGGGSYQYRHDGEHHLWTPATIGKLQQAVRSGDETAYREYAALINDQAQHLCTLRGLFAFRDTQPVPLEEVESVDAIARRFVTGAMSFGSISKEAHEALAIAMNRLGGMSNSGEGGEDPARYLPLASGDSLCSAIKQVASGRFGVTAEYLANAREIQIKIAQGAKPGEGGQLPGHKVDEIIARVRHSTPWVTLISPPPHHDIYSIEDLAQLIYDLKCANPNARISVKLVSEVGVGTIAAGVAKAHADMVLISGHDGGTGASPLTSIKHAGLPWELGLAETQQTLVMNGLRGRIRIQADGQMKTGRDIVIAALLGAEEYGFATAPLVTLGCVMMRKCHSNTCPVGVATQDPELRKRFRGKPEHVVNFFRFVAAEIREILAALGLRTLDEAVGRCDLLAVNPAIDAWKARNLDFSAIFARPADASLPVRCITAQDHGMERSYDQRLLPVAEPAIASGGTTPVAAEFAIHNVDRTAGATLSHRIALRFGHDGLPEDSIRFTFHGCAGQSFGAFLAKGVTFTLVGEANDYLGKGLSGGRIVVVPPPDLGCEPGQNTIAGNVLLYGATGGEVFLHGQAGERFAIRNSGATAVVEGAGDHCCEYMTGGRVVVLGPVGVNFGAGMSGGIAYVYDDTNKFDDCCNLAMVDLEPVVQQEDVEELHGLVERHLAHTGSLRARAILADWDNALPRFVKVLPMEYRRALGQMMKEDAAIERPAVTA
jgi:glutamate synthase domain-containing protein 2/glutamate synthase domain-containing protein 1/glutamate synthase domain-containing protein 3